MSKTEKATFSHAVIALMKGVTYREDDPLVWEALLEFEARVRDHVAVLGLELILDPSEGHAYLRQRSAEDEERELPRLIPRRQLSYHVSLLLALLRKKLAEVDSDSGEARLIISRAEIAELVRIFMPATSNEARVADRLDAHVNKIVELGFLRPLRGQEGQFEVRRILKAYVDAQWLQELEQRLAEYRAHAEAE